MLVPVETIPSGPPTSRPGRRWKRGVAVGVVAAMGLLSVTVVSLQVPAVGTAAANFALDRLAPLAPSTARVREFRVTWLTRIELSGLRVTRGDTVLVSADTARLVWRPWALVAGRLEIATLDLAGVAVNAGSTAPTGVEPAPSHSLSTLLRGRFYRGPELRIGRWTARDIRVRATGAATGAGPGGHPPGPSPAGISAEGGFAARDIALGREFTVTLDSMVARLELPAPVPHRAALRLAGRLGDGRLECTGLQWTSSAGRVRARGVLAVGEGDSLRAVRVVAHADSFDVAALAPLFAQSAGAPPSLGGVLSADIDVSGIDPGRLSGSIAARLDSADLAGWRFGSSNLTAALALGRADCRLETSLEGAGAVIEGWIRPLDRSPAYDLHADLARLPARLPGIPWWSAMAARAPMAVALDARGRGFSGAVLEVEGEARGEAGDLSLRGRLNASGEPAWWIDSLVIRRFDIARLSGDSVASSVTGRLVAHGAGSDSGGPRATARLELAPSRYGSWDVSGGFVAASLDGRDMSAGFALEVNGGTISADRLTWRDDGPSRFRVAAGRLQAIDLSRLAGAASPASDLNATFDLEGAGLSALWSSGAPVAALRRGDVTARGHVRLGPSHLKGRALHDGEIRFDLHDGGIELEGDVASDAGWAAMDGRLRPFDPAPGFRLGHARFGDVDPGAWAAVPGGGTRLSGGLVAEGSWIPGPRDGPPLEHLSAALQLERSQLASVVIDRGELHATLEHGQAHAAASLVTRGVPVGFEGDARVSGPDRGGKVQGNVPLAALVGWLLPDSLQSEGSVRLAIEFEGPAAASGEVSGRGMLEGSGRIDDARLDSLELGFRFGDGTLTLDALALHSNVARIEASGAIALADSTGGAPVAAPATGLHGEITVLDPKPLARMFGADSLQLGAGTLTLDLSGPAGARTVDVRSSLRSLVWNTLRLADAEIRAGGTLDARWRPRGGRLGVEARSVAFSGLLIGTTTASADLDGARVRFDLGSAPDPRHRVRLAGTVAADSAGRSLVLETFDVSADSARLGLAGPARIRFGGDRLEVERFELRSPNGRLSARGVIDRRGEQAFRLEARQLELALASVWLGRNELAGRLDADLTLEGPSEAPRGTGLVMARLVAGGRRSGTVRSTLTWDGSGLDLSGAFTAATGESLSIAGRLPLALSLASANGAEPPRRVRVFDGSVDLRILAEHFPLSVLSPLLGSEGIDARHGTLNLNARIHGTNAALAGEGRIELAGGQIMFPALGVTHRDVALVGRFAGDRFLIETCRASTAQGRIEVRGELRIRSLTTIEPDLTLIATRGLFVDRRDLRVAATGKVHFGGTLAAPVVKGEARLGGSHYYVDQEVVAGGRDRPAVTLTPADLRMLNEHFSWVEPAPSDRLRDLFDALDLDLAIRLERDNWVRQLASPRLSVEVTGETQVRKTPHGELRLLGRLEPVAGRGFVEQFGRSFDLAGGEVLLNGPMSDHRVAVRADYRARGSAPSSGDADVVVHLEVRGSLDRLSLTLSSEPALSETEIVTYIATGRGRTSVQPASSGAHSDAAVMARDFGLATVSRGLEDVAQNLIGLDVLQLRFDPVQGATLVAGRYVDPSLYLGFRQPIHYKDTESSATGSEFRTRGEIEYEAYRWLVLNLQGEASQVRSFVRVRHEY